MGAALYADIRVCRRNRSPTISPRIDASASPSKAADPKRRLTNTRGVSNYTIARELDSLGFPTSRKCDSMQHVVDSRTGSMSAIEMRAKI